MTARTSSFAFRGKEQDIRKIAEALGVGTILEGSVRRAGSRIRVTTQLINAAHGYHLWSERYDREMTDVLGVQDEIAAATTESAGRWKHKGVWCMANLLDGNSESCRFLTKQKVGTCRPTEQCLN
ncbi:MAG TPA: hypothetical protein VG204_18255 [Terriglobia bacterium]|nr:hypothetical protein [Terriglobia bacterium]